VGIASGWIIIKCRTRLCSQHKLNFVTWSDVKTNILLQYNPWLLIFILHNVHECCRFVPGSRLLNIKYWWMFPMRCVWVFLFVLGKHFLGDGKKIYVCFKAVYIIYYIDCGILTSGWRWWWSWWSWRAITTELHLIYYYSEKGVTNCKWNNIKTE